MGVIRVLAVLVEDVDRRLVEATLDPEPSREVVRHADYLQGFLEQTSLDVVGYAEHRDDWQGFLEQDSDVVVVACGDYSRPALSIVGWAVKHRPDRPVVVLTAEEPVPGGVFEQARMAGADGVLPLPMAPLEMSFHLDDLIAFRKGLAQSGQTAAPLIAVVGMEGRIGRTLVATNLAVALAERGLDVVLVDVNLQVGDVGLHLGLSPERTLYDLMKAGPPFDHEKLERHLMRHSSGVQALLAPTRPDQASAVTIDYLRDVYGSLRTICDSVIVDTPPRFTGEAIATINVSSAACMVVAHDSIVKSTMDEFHMLSRMGVLFGTGHPYNVTLLLNRAVRPVVLPDRLPWPDVLVPSDPAIPRSIKNGTPIVTSDPESEAAKAFRKLADRYDRPPGSRPALLPPGPMLPPTAPAGVREPRRPIRPNLNATSTVDPADHTDLPDETGRPDQSHGEAA